MGVFESLFGFLIGGGLAATGAGINAHEKKQRDRELQREKDDKLNKELAYAALLKSNEDQEIRAFRIELESWIGHTLEEDWKHQRYYNLIREYELAVQYCDDLLAEFKKQHPPGSIVSIITRKLGVYYDHELQRSMYEMLPTNHEIALPYNEAVYNTQIADVFWEQEIITYRGPIKVLDETKIVTYGVGSGIYALGEARKQIIREGFLPSNCRSKLWVNWSPYVTYRNDLWNKEFYTAVDLYGYFSAELRKPNIRDQWNIDRIREQQQAYEKCHPKHFNKEESDEPKAQETNQ